MDFAKDMKKTIALVCLTGLLFLTGCVGFSDSLPTVTAPEDTGFVLLKPGEYDCKDTALLTAVNTKAGQMTFYNLMKKRKYTLSYDGATRFYDKYGSALTVEQLEPGELVDVNFVKGKKLLIDLTRSPQAFVIDQVEKHEINQSTKSMQVLGETYQLDGNVFVYSAGKEIELMDIDEQDVLKITGMDRKVVSIQVQKGHGYLRLSNEEYFLGGWIEVGQALITKIEPEMLLTVPEGDYQVLLSHAGLEGIKEVAIKRGEETLLDVGDLKKDDLIKYGNLIFTTSPEDTAVFVDGKEVDDKSIFKTEYGLHQIMAKADGYETLIQYIKVGQPNATVAVNLDKKKDKNSLSSNSISKKPEKTDSNSVSGNSISGSNTGTVTPGNSNTTSGNTNTNTNTTGTNPDTSISATNGYQINIQSPEGVEVYMDGTYVGISPISTAKKSGNHVITLRKSGFLTRSYTIEVDDDAKNTDYSFSDLTEME